MFTIFSTLHSRLMDENDKRILEEMLDNALKESVFQWLREIPLQQIKFRFCPAFKKDDSTMGAFSILRPLTVFLRDDPLKEIMTVSPGRAFWIEAIFPIIVHELRHLWQFRKHPLIFILCSIPGLRFLTIERDANRCQKDAESISRNYTASRDRADFEAVMKRCRKQKNNSNSNERSL